MKHTTIKSLLLTVVLLSGILQYTGTYIIILVVGDIKQRLKKTNFNSSQYFIEFNHT